jgi:hypothetical protein
VSPSSATAYKANWLVVAALLGLDELLKRKSKYEK